MKIVLYFILFIISIVFMLKNHLANKKGNKDNSRKYSDAEELYRKALNTPQ